MEWFNSTLKPLYENGKVTPLAYQAMKDLLEEIGSKYRVSCFFTGPPERPELHPIGFSYSRVKGLVAQVEIEGNGKVYVMLVGEGISEGTSYSVTERQAAISMARHLFSRA